MRRLGVLALVRAHRVKGRFATRSARTSFAIGAAPRGYKCRATTGSVAVTCTHRVRTSRYLLANPVQ